MKPDKDTAVAIVSGPGLDAQLDFFRYTIESYRAKEQAEQ